MAPSNASSAAAPAFWQALLDELVTARLNVLSLWMLHPWPYVSLPPPPLLFTSVASVHTTAVSREHTRGFTTRCGPAVRDAEAAGK